MNCTTCCFYVPSDEYCFGRCHRNAPSNCGFPVVREEDMCGDYIEDGSETSED